jgi:hypothetical protein
MIHHNEAVALVAEIVEQLRHDTRSDADQMPPVAEEYDLDAVVGRAFDRADDGTMTLREWVSPWRLVGLVSQHRRETMPVPTPAHLPCPEWCDREAGHPFEQYANSTRRDHTRRYSDRDVCATVELRERSPEPSSGMTDLRMDPAALLVRIHFGVRGTQYLTGDGSRRLAAQLHAAADLYDQERSSMTDAAPHEGPTA